MADIEQLQRAPIEQEPENKTQSLSMRTVVPPSSNSARLTLSTNTAISARGSPAGVLQGIQQAAADFSAFFYNSHGALFDSQMVKWESRGLKREWIGFTGLALFAALLFTSAAPFLANAASIAFPIWASMAVLRGENSGESLRWLSFWTAFGLFSLLDSRLGQFSAYWLLKVAVSAFLYLPQTQGAALVHQWALEPAAKFLDAHGVRRLIQ